MRRHHLQFQGALVAAACALTILGCGDPEGAATANAPESTASAGGGDGAGGDDAAALAARGQRIYNSLCLTCHQADGGGVPNMQPPLDGSAVVLGDPARVVDITLRGIGGGGIALESSGEWFQAMGGYQQLSDEDIAAVSTWIRQAWGNDASAVSPELVAERRAAIPAG